MLRARPPPETAPAPGAAPPPFCPSLPALGPALPALQEAASPKPRHGAGTHVLLLAALPPTASKLPLPVGSSVRARLAAGKAT